MPDDPDDPGDGARPGRRATHTPATSVTRLAHGTPAVPTPTTADLAPGTTIDRYRVVRAIARGGFGAVYEVVDVSLGRGAALKVLHADIAGSRDMVLRFEREARLVNLVHHPGVVEIVDFGELEDGRPYFVMELLQGEDLRGFLERVGAVPVATAVAILTPLCSALDAAHAKGIIHRDLKPSNVFLADDGAGGQRVVLLDFGVAKLLDEGGPALTRSRQAIGTPTSMAPEQVRGEAVDARTDVYALGNLLFALLTGRQPFAEETAAMALHMHLHAATPRPSLNAPVDPRLDLVVARAMAKEPGRRPPSASAFLAELRAALAPAPAHTSTDAVVVAVVLVHVGADVLRDPDDALLDQLDRILCESGAALTALGFVPVIEGIDRLVMRRGTDDLAPARTALVDLVERVERAIGAVALSWTMQVHVGVPGAADDPLELERWLEEDRRDRLVMTAQAQAVLR